MSAATRALLGNTATRRRRGWPRRSPISPATRSRPGEAGSSSFGATRHWPCSTRPIRRCARPPSSRPPAPRSPPAAAPQIAGEPIADEFPVELDTLAPLVDRESEMHWLRGTWRQARRGAGRVLLLSGPSNIGKTRLAAELAAYVHASGSRV